MTARDPITRPLGLAAMAVSIIVTAVFALWLVQHFIRMQHQLIAHSFDVSAVPNVSSRPTHLLAGALVRLSAGADGPVIQRRVTGTDFALGLGESLDAKLGAGRFRAEFVVRFWTLGVTQARLGATIENGKVMILHHGAPVLAEAAGSPVRTVMSTLAAPVSLAAGVDEITVIFENDGQRPCSLGLLWQPLSPEPASQPARLPAP